MGYYNYYKKKKRTKPFKFIQRKTYMSKSKVTYKELKEEDEANKDILNPISLDTFSTILKAAITYAKNNKN